MSEESQSRSSDQEEQHITQFVVPNDKKQLRACLKCLLLKTEQQWKDDKRCENCGSFDMDYNKFVTKNFDGIVCLINPEASWIRKKLKIRPGAKLFPGAYAMNCSNH